MNILGLILFAIVFWISFWLSLLIVIVFTISIIKKATAEFKNKIQEGLKDAAK